MPALSEKVRPRVQRWLWSVFVVRGASTLNEPSTKLMPLATCGIHFGRDRIRYANCNSVPAYRNEATSDETPTHRSGLPGEPGANPRTLCGHVNAPFTDPTWPYPRQPSTQRARSKIGRSRPNASRWDLTPNTVIGGGAAATAANFH